MKTYFCFIGIVCTEITKNSYLELVFVNYRYEFFELLTLFCLLKLLSLRVLLANGKFGHIYNYHCNA